jgi:Mg-chelatase subunit ChlI
VRRDGVVLPGKGRDLRGLDPQLDAQALAGRERVVAADVERAAEVAGEQRIEHRPTELFDEASSGVAIRRT